MARKSKDELLDEYLSATGRGFSYDPEKDPVAMSQKRLYMQEADRQTADTLGKTAAMTGGVPSSYAVSAAAQAGNYQKSKWAAEVPQYEANAYARWRQEAQDKLGAYETVAAAEQQQLQNDRYDKEYADKRADLAWERNYQKEQNDRTAAMNLWKAQGTASPQVAAVLGVPVGAAYNGSGGSGSGSSGKEYSVGTQQAAYTKWKNGKSLTASDIDALLYAGYTLDEITGGSPTGSDESGDKRYEAQAAYDLYKKSPEKVTAEQRKLLREYGYMDANGKLIDEEGRTNNTTGAYQSIQKKIGAADYGSAIDLLEDNRALLNDEQAQDIEEEIKNMLQNDPHFEKELFEKIHSLSNSGSYDMRNAIIQKYRPYLSEAMKQKLVAELRIYQGV